MKTIISILILFTSALSFGQNVIKVNAGTDTVNIAGVSTIIKYKAHLTSVIFKEDGSPLRVQYLLKTYAFDNSTELNPSGNDVDRELLRAKEITFECNGGKYINTVTKKYAPGGGANEVLLAEYFKTKAVNSYPGVANADPLSDLIEGILREVVSIKQANKELNN